MLLMFNSKTYTDSRTVKKHTLIPSYSSDLTEPKGHKAKLKKISQLKRV